MSTSRFAVERPRPVPRGFVVKNGVKMRSRMSGGMPGPVSATAIRHVPSLIATKVRIVPLPCMACAALRNRFSNTICSSWGSTMTVGAEPSISKRTSRAVGSWLTSADVSFASATRSTGDGSHLRRSRKEEQILHELVQGVEPGDDLADDGGVLASRRQPAADDLDRAAHAGQRVPDLVGDDGRHLPKRHERRLLAQPLVGRPQALLGALAHDDAGQGARERAEELLLCRILRMPGGQVHVEHTQHRLARRDRDAVMPVGRDAGVGDLVSFVNAAAVERLPGRSDPSAQAMAQRHPRAAFENVPVDAIVGLEHQFPGVLVHQEHGAHAQRDGPRVVQHERQRVV